MDGVFDGMIGKPHMGLAGRISIEPVDHQDERPMHQDTVDPRELVPPESATQAGDGTRLGDPTTWVTATEKRLAAIERQLADANAADPQIIRSLLDFNERLTRIEKQVAFMSSAQALQERQIALHKRATGLDMAIKACGQGPGAEDFTTMADAFVIWLEPGVSG